MNVREITKEWLKKEGYDGLLCEEFGCACGFNEPNFMSCDDPGVIYCQPGIKRVINSAGDCLIVPFKESLEGREV